MRRPTLYFSARGTPAISTPLKHLVDDIWPLVLKQRPDAVLKVAGSICADLTPAQAETQGVELLGRVQSLESISGSPAIGLAPTRIASGVSIKVAEYLMLGNAVRRLSGCAGRVPGCAR